MQFDYRPTYDTNFGVFFLQHEKKCKNCTFGTLNGTLTRVSLCCAKKKEKKAQRKNELSESSGGKK